jgi:ribosomal protein S18 acetylase RimI-like enzyme
MPATAEFLHQTYRIEKLDSRTPPQLFCELAKLHIDSIHGGIIESLGEPFLASLYHQLSKQEAVFTYVAVRDDAIIGFVVGTIEIRGLIQNIGWVGMARLALLAYGKLWRPNVLRKALQTLGYFFRRPNALIFHDAVAEAAKLGHAELLAIAVAAEARGQGVGRTLVENLESAFLNWSDATKYFVSTTREEVASNAFYRSAGFKLIGQKPHHDLILNVYQKDLER